MSDRIRTSLSRHISSTVTEDEKTRHRHRAVTRTTISEREIRSIKIDGNECLLGAPGSLILACDQCGDESFRDAEDWKLLRTVEKCLCCGGDQLKHPVRIADMDGKWLPLWSDLGWL